MTDTNKCSLCPQKGYKTLTLGYVSHEFCAFHAGFMIGIEDLIRNNKSIWTRNSSEEV